MTEIPTDARHRLSTHRPRRHQDHPRQLRPTPSRGHPLMGMVGGAMASLTGSRELAADIFEARLRARHEDDQIDGDWPTPGGQHD
jgi:hypothetical protein